MAWNPDQYLRYADARLRPAADLLARVPLQQPAEVFDLGCGAGNATRLLAGRWPAAQVTGVDDSEPMLAQARQAWPQAQWVRADIGRWVASAPADLIYSNAVLHWLPGHAQLLPRLMGMLKPGGVLALQMPRNFAAPSHTAIAETVSSGPWNVRLQHLLGPVPVTEPAAYFDMLQPLAAELDIWETEYLHVLDGRDPVKEWTKGTWLKRFLDALDADEAARFEAGYADRVRSAYPPRADGRTLFPFRRLFIVAIVARAG
jgi:trans-aconitate 2-methyltransferase